MAPGKILRRGSGRTHREGNFEGVELRDEDPRRSEDLARAKSSSRGESFESATRVEPLTRVEPSIHAKSVAKFKSLNRVKSVTQIVRSANHPAQGISRNGAPTAFELPHDSNNNHYDSKGRCLRHPHVRLRQRKLFGGWKVLAESCPDCQDEGSRRTWLASDDDDVPKTMGKEDRPRNEDVGEEGRIRGGVVAEGALCGAVALRGAKRSDSDGTAATASTSCSDNAAATILENTNSRDDRGTQSNPTSMVGWDAARSASVQPPTSKPASEEAIATSPKTTGANEPGRGGNECGGHGSDDDLSLQERQRSRSESASMRQQVERMRQQAESYISNYMLEFDRSESSLKNSFKFEASHKTSGNRREEEEEGFARHSAATSRRSKDHRDGALRTDSSAAARLASAPPSTSKPATAKEGRRRGKMVVRHMEYTDAHGMRGHYSGEVNRDFFPHGNGTMTYDSGVRTEGVWKRGEWRRPPRAVEGRRRGGDGRGGSGQRRSKSESAMMIQQAQLMRQQAELYISDYLAKPDGSKFPWHGHSGLEAMHERSNHAREDGGEKGFIASGSGGDGGREQRTRSASGPVKVGDSGKVLSSYGQEASRPSFPIDVVPTIDDADNGGALAPQQQWRSASEARGGGHAKDSFASILKAQFARSA